MATIEENKKAASTGLNTTQIYYNYFVLILYRQSVICEPGVLSCMHGYVKDSNGTRIFIKDCERHQTFFQTVGCVRVKNEYEGEAIDDHLCFCDTPDCNKEYCHPEDCSCAYADPDHCPPEPVDPTSKYLYV